MLVGMSNHLARRTNIVLLSAFSFALAPLLVGAACNPMSGETPRAPEAAQLAQAERPKVEVFVTDWCPYCQRLEAFLQKNQVEYVRYNVEQDEKAAAQHDRMTGGQGGIPVTRVGTHVVQGYRPELIGRYLGIKAAD
jgi:glutaredoxin